MAFERVKFGRRANRRFNYQPIYYDADREELTSRVEQIKDNKSNKVEGYQARIKASYQRRNVAYNSDYNYIKSAARLRQLAIAILLGLALYLVFQTNTFSIVYDAFYN
ncbi:MAG: hypothetical protein ACI8ZN_001056 [Bacteroidia bacterium]|jgi:hypothetical protein